MASVQREKAPPIAVIGGANVSGDLAQLALEVGRGIAAGGGIVVCGGRGGVMEQAARGCVEQGGTSLGILPGTAEDGPGNPYLTHRVFTGLGQARNQVIVLSAAAVVAIGGEWGTLSEIGLALKHRVPVVLLASFEVALPDGSDDPLLFRARDPAEAVAIAFEKRRSLP